jgi:hypothetical protein
MVAADVGKAAGREAHAVEPVLVETVRRRLQRQMGHAVPGQLGERAMQRDRVRRGQRAIDLAPRRDESDGADAGSGLSRALPDLAREGGDRGLAARSGDRGNGLGLAAEDARRSDRQRPARIADANEGRSLRQRQGRHLLRHDRNRAGLDRLLDEAQPVRLRARDRHEQVAGLDLAAVGGDAAHVERVVARIGDGIDGEELCELHGNEAVDTGHTLPVMPGLVPGIHVFFRDWTDGQDAPGHDCQRRALARISRSAVGRSKRGVIESRGAIRAMMAPAVGAAFQPEVA